MGMLSDGILKTKSEFERRDKEMIEEFLKCDHDDMTIKEFKKGIC
jgi:hypothetical protein